MTSLSDIHVLMVDDSPQMRFVIRCLLRASGIYQMSEAETAAEAEAKFLEKTALRRLATPDEVATHVAFLASPMAAHLTGTSLTIDGGSTKSP